MESGDNQVLGQSLLSTNLGGIRRYHCHRSQYFVRVGLRGSGNASAREKYKTTKKQVTARTFILHLTYIGTSLVHMIYLRGFQSGERLRGEVVRDDAISVDIEYVGVFTACIRVTDRCITASSLGQQRL